MKRITVVLSAAAVILLAAARARGQDEMFNWLDPRLGNLKTEIEIGESSSVSRNVSRQGTGMGFTQQSFKFSVPLSQDKRREWSFATGLRHLDVDTSARMPDTGERFPSDLWDVGISASYRRRHDNGWISAVAFSVAAAGDNPFASGGETTLGLTGFLRVPGGGRNAWLYYVNFSSELDEVRNYPIGGAGYHWVPGDGQTFQAIIGAPVMWVQYKPLKRLTIEASALAPLNAAARASYALRDGLSLYTAYDWSGWKFIRHDRRDNDHRLNIRRQRVRAGLKWRITDSLWLDVGAGYAFDRYVYEGRDFGGSDFNRFRLGNGPFAAVRMGVSF